MKKRDSFYSIKVLSYGEYSEKGSKFLAYAAPVKSVEEAVEYVESIRKEHHKARHHCYAYRIGISDDIFRINDDGEPSGTAGQPIFGQIKKGELRDIVIVVVRYFGGKLLGASGLIRAYKTAAAEAISNSTRKLVQLYKPVFAQVEYLKEPFFMDALSQLELEVLERNYGQKAMITFAVPRSSVESTLKAICGLILERSASDIEDPFKCINEIAFTVRKTEKA